MANNMVLDDVFGALADPTRRRMIEQLARGPQRVGELSAEFPLSQPAISKHVRVLEDAGLLRREIVGRVHYCTLTPGAIAAAADWLERQRAFWNATLDRLDTLLAEPGHTPKRT